MHRLHHQWTIDTILSMIPQAIKIYACITSNVDGVKERSLYIRLSAFPGYLSIPLMASTACRSFSMDDPLLTEYFISKSVLRKGICNVWAANFACYHDCKTLDMHHTVDSHQTLLGIISKSHQNYSLPFLFFSFLLLIPMSQVTATLLRVWRPQSPR